MNARAIDAICHLGTGTTAQTDGERVTISENGNAIRLTTDGQEKLREWLNKLAGRDAPWLTERATEAEIEAARAQQVVRDLRRALKAVLG